ncbi:hypothetical protein BUALT_Bualt14G0040200 [Buddleja alternifolia]|uniref:Uncharacterized protein n=1 Tax=Buddleja alternifolia TaxID=168488 RepID=A0AAV6WRU6_9LAMI|nr:hypothetical protein BUALT_Bualt14G0040200 [Buddleja alternifolia]
MSKNYDNWERLVSAVLRRETDREIALNHSRSVSSRSSTSNLSFVSNLMSSLFDHNDQSLVRTMNYADLPMEHTDWKALMQHDKHVVVWKSASMSFSLDKSTGKNCFMLRPTRLRTSSGGQFEHYWKIKSYPESRFSEAAELLDSFMFSIQGRIRTQMLSLETSYAAYLLFRLSETYKNIASANSFIRHFYDKPDHIHSTGQTSRVVFGPDDGTNGQIPVSRAYGWMEVKMGDFYVPQGDNRNAEVTLLELSVNEMSGLIVEALKSKMSSSTSNNASISLCDHEDSVESRTITQPNRAEKEMSRNYDNWKKLVRRVLRRENDRQIALNHSSSVSSILSSTDRSFRSSSRFDHEQSVVDGQRSNQLPADYTDLAMDHTDWRSCYLIHM